MGKKGLRRKGTTMKRACRTTESRGCRAAGGGRKDRFEGYKAAVKQTFTAELENGQEVGGAAGPADRRLHEADTSRKQVRAGGCILMCILSAF